MVRKKQLNIQNLDEKKGKEYAEVLFFGDVHWGSPQCDRDRVKRQLDYCEKNSIYVMLMGDLIENSTKRSVGAGIYEQIMNPQDQQDEIIELLKPLADKGLLLGSLHGNHEDRTYKDSGINPSKIIAQTLEVPYLGEAGWNLWRVGNQSYLVYTLHGATGSRYIHTKLNAARKIAQTKECDVLAMGHVHDLVTASILTEYIDKRNKTVKQKKKHLLITGHYLKHEGGYAQARGMPAGKMGSPKVKLFGNKHDTHISI